MSFGHDFKKKHFPLSNNEYTPVNHGLYGLPPQVVVDKYNEAMNLDLASPDTYILTQQPKEYVELLKAVALVLNCPYKNLAFVENATSGVNTVLRSYPFKKGDKVALTSIAYGACANTFKFLELMVGIELVTIDLVFPLTDEEVVSAFKKVFDTHSITMAFFDTVVSMPGVKLPFKELTKLCSDYNVVSLVDGAHSIGLIPVDFSDFAPDYYVTNLHKWLYLPRGCAVLYVDKKHFRTIQTLPVSHSYVDVNAELTPDQLDNLLVSKFTFIGSKNFAAVACVETALKFRNEVCGGEEKIREYCFDLARKVGELTTKLWPGTSLLENANGTLLTSMVTLQVPIENYSSDFDASDKTALASFLPFVVKYQLENFKTYAPFGPHAGKILIRFSCQTYNEISDYEYAIHAAQEAVKAYFAQSS